MPNREILSRDDVQEAPTSLDFRIWSAERNRRQSLVPPRC